MDDNTTLIDNLLSGAVKALSVPIPTIPTYGGTDTSAARKDIARASTTREESNKVIDSSRGDYATATEREKAALDRKGVAEGDEARADQERAQTIATITQTIGREVFGEGDIATNAAILAKEVARLRPGVDSSLKEIQALNSPGDPLNWLTNQFILPGKVAAYNAQATELNALQNTLDNAIATSEAINTFAAKAVPSITANQAKAKADKAGAIVDIAKANADEQLAKINVDFSVHKMANDISIANQTLDMTKIQQQENHMKYQSQINAINLADTHANRMLKAAQLLETIEKTKGLDVVLKNYDRVMGHPDGTTNRFMFERFSDARKQDMVAIGAGSLGADPFAGMLTYYANRPGPGASPETSRLMGFLREKSEVVQLEQKVQGTDEKQKPAAIAGRLRTIINDEILSANKQGSLFYELTPAAVLATNRISPDSIVAKNLEPFTKTGQTVPTAMVVQAIATAIPNPVEAGAAIAQYYRANIDIRNASMNTSLIGIKLPTSYVIRDSFGNFSFGQTPFDLTKPEEATKYITMLRTKAARSTYVPSGMGSENITNSNITNPLTLPAVRPD